MTQPKINPPQVLKAAQRLAGSAAEALLELHLRSAHIHYVREVHHVIPRRKFRFDFLCARHPHRVLVEVQGGVWAKGKSGHSSGVGISRDCEKFSLAAAHGYRVLPVTPEQIRTGMALNWIEQALSHH